MKKFFLFFIVLIMLSLLFADVKNPDKPLKGEWNFNSQKEWEIDRIGDKLFERPSELRASQDEMLYFHDFGHKMSYVFDHTGEFINSFAKQGAASGEVDRYINCFIADDKVVIGTPDKLHFYTQEGTFIKSYENNLFERFPLLFISENEFLYAPRVVSDFAEDKEKIVRKNLKTGKEIGFDEFSMAKGEKSSQGGMSLVILGLTPQIKIGFEPDSKRIYVGRSDDYSIHVGELTGRRLFTFSLDRERKAVTEKDKWKHFEQTRLPKERIEKILPTLPDFLTYFMRIQVVKGLIFIFSTESLDRRQKKLAIDIFSPEGKYLYRSYLKFGDGTPLYTHVEKVAIKNTHLYAMLENKEGRNSLAKYKIDLPPFNH
jgi:hypothetical protein